MAETSILLTDIILHYDPEFFDDDDESNNKKKVHNLEQVKSVGLQFEGNCMLSGSICL